MTNPTSFHYGNSFPYNFNVPVFQPSFSSNPPRPSEVLLNFLKFSSQSFSSTPHISNVSPTTLALFEKFDQSVKYMSSLLAFIRLAGFATGNTLSHSESLSQHLKDISDLTIQIKLNLSMFIVRNFLNQSNDVGISPSILSIFLTSSESFLRSLLPQEDKTKENNTRAEKRRGSPDINQESPACKRQKK